MTTIATPVPPPIAVRQYLRATTESVFLRGETLFFLRLGSATLAQCTEVSRPNMSSASEQLERLLGKPWPFPGRPPRHDFETWTVTDDWPERVPVTDAEVDVFEAWFGDLFDEMFGPYR